MATELRSSMPMELVGKDGVMNRVSSGHKAKAAPTVNRSRTTKFSMPAS